MPGVLDSFRLDDRVACVTGTTRGIGRTAAIALAEAGCDIVHLDRHDPADTRSEIEGLGRRSALVDLDLEAADAAACERAIEAAAAAFGRLDILVNSAGVVARGPVLDVTAEDALRVLHVDLVCVLALARAAGRVFVAQGSGAIVNVASLLSFQAAPFRVCRDQARASIAQLKQRALANQWAVRQASTSTRSHRLHGNRQQPPRCTTTSTAAARFSSTSPPAAGARQTTSPAP